MTDVFINPTDCPYYLITRASLAITSAMKLGFADAGLGDVKPAYLGVFMCLWMEDCMGDTLGKVGKEEGMRLVDLGRCAGLEPSSMTGLIDRMEKDGLLYRTDDPTDRRAHIIRLTDRGHDLRKNVIDIVGKTISKAFWNIPADRMQAAKDVLRTVLVNASKGSLEP
ncbi:MAG TPA: MarR family transcriptional regulator [Spirochaetota bacterium]|nr:MarR family transcriptional regulator [Spirochaetota bacterium]